MMCSFSPQISGLRLIFRFISKIWRYCHIIISGLVTLLIRLRHKIGIRVGNALELAANLLGGKSVELKVKVLGAFEARDTASQTVAFPTSKAKALFAYLLLEEGPFHTREKLSNLFWSNVGEKRSRANLRQTLTRVRQALPPSLSDCVATQSGAIKLDTRAITTDVSNFNHWQKRGTFDDLEQAAALYRGEFLEGFTAQGEAFETWLRHERLKYREHAIDCFGKLLVRYQTMGASTRGIEICNRLLALDPYRESVHRMLMSFYLDQDRRGAALAQFEECRTLLQDELDVLPEDETLALYKGIREQSEKTRYTRNPALSRRAPAQGFERDRSSRAVTNLIGRSPWQGASWTKPSIAVLPFDCLTQKDTGQYLCDGLAEDITTNLARFSDLHVIARNSSFALRSQSIDLRDVGKTLGARYILEGSLQRDDENIRVTAQLIEAETGFHVWADRYDEKTEDLIHVRDELTGRIASVLMGRIEQHQLKKIRAQEPEHAQAYECWLHGLYLLHKDNGMDAEKSREYFEQALTIDPDYARAWAGLAMSWYKTWSCFNWTSWWKLEDKAQGFAKKALELDDEDHHVHCILGIISLYTRDFGRSRYHLQKAEQINPNDARTLANSAIAWSFLGEPERAVRMAELAIRLDPYHPDWYLSSLGHVYYVAKDYERAIAVLELAPDGFCETRAYLAAAYAQTGDIDGAAPHVAEFIRKSCERGVGSDPDTDAPRYVEVMLKSNPFVRPKDAAHLSEGVRLAGLPLR
jgi:TolB-like protein/DNA-binding SARP family transcriptional activator/Tfp pilus assembly protein PilF